jgi:hypothetical protein
MAKPSRRITPLNPASLMVPRRGNVGPARDHVASAGVLGPSCNLACPRARTPEIHVEALLPLLGQSGEVIGVELSEAAVRASGRIDRGW